MKPSKLLVFTLCLAGAVGLGAASVAASTPPRADLTERGQYIFSLAGGCACHTPPNGTPNAGAREFPIPMAKLYSTNLTADKATGL